MNLLETTFPTIEWTGIESVSHMNEMLGHIYNTDHSQLIGKNIGFDPHYLRIFTDNLVNTKDTNFDFYKALDCDGPEWQNEYQRFEYKINSIYNRPEVEYLLENGTLRFAILDVVYNFYRSDLINVMGPIGEEIKQKSIIRAFTEVNLLYPEKHYSYLFCSRVHKKFFKRYYDQEMKKMTVADKVGFWVWSLNKGVHTKGMAENLEKTVYSDYTDLKELADWDVDLYCSTAGKRKDPGVYNPPLTDSHSRKIAFESYGKFTEFPYFRYQLTPVVAFLDKFLNYPNAFMNTKRKNEQEGNPEPVITQPVHKWLQNRISVPSSLPQADSELRINPTPEESERTILKMAYIYDNPDKFRNVIKWRHVRRYARDVYYGKAKK